MKFYFCETYYTSSVPSIVVVAAWKSPQRNKGMGGIEPFVIFPMAALYFSIMPRRKWTDQLMTDSMLL